MLIVSLLLAFIAAVIFVVWYTEARTFVALFQKLTFPGRTGPAFYANKTDLFHHSALLEENIDVIRDEYLSVIGVRPFIPRMHNVDDANHKISFDSGPAWKTIVLKGFDGWFAANCQLFPRTTALLRRMPDVSSAMFSILEPGVKIPPHTGKFNGILRYHLGLSIPKQGHCYIEVNGEKYYWKDDEGVLFNDVYLHEVNNDTNEHRVILFIDVKKRTSPLVNAINDMLLKAVHASPGFRRARANGAINLD